MPAEFEFSERAARAMERIYLTPDVVGQRVRTLELLRVTPGERVIDLGAGLGLLTYDLSGFAGPKGSVVGVDPSDAMLKISAERCGQLANVEIKSGDANKIPCESGCADVVVSTQVLEYVRDIADALQEIRRVLATGGRVVLVDTAWDSAVLATSDRALNRRVFDAWEEHLAHPNLPAQLPQLLENAGFSLTHTEILPMYSQGHTEHQYAGGILRNITNFVTGRQGLTEEEVQRWSEDWQREVFFSLNRYIFCATKT